MHESQDYVGNPLVTWLEGGVHSRESVGFSILFVKDISNRNSRAITCYLIELLTCFATSTQYPNIQTFDMTPTSWFSKPHKSPHPHFIIRPLKPPDNQLLCFFSALVAADVVSEWAQDPKIGSKEKGAWSHDRIGPEMVVRAVHGVYPSALWGRWATQRTRNRREERVASVW